MKILFLLILLLPLAASVGQIDAHAGSITEINMHVTQTVTPEECFNMGEQCILNLLCPATECVEIGGYIYIHWIW